MMNYFKGKLSLPLRNLGALLATAFMLWMPTEGMAQTDEITTTTDQAFQSTWKGVTWESVLDNNTTFYLYNLGTGRFLKAGGEWGISALLTLHDYGLPFTMNTDNSPSGSDSWNPKGRHVIYANVQTTDNANAMGVNALGWSNTGGASNYPGIILDSRSTGNYQDGGTNRYYSRDWDFVRLTGDNLQSGHTFYLMREKIRHSSKGTYVSFVGGQSGDEHPVYKQYTNPGDAKLATFDSEWAKDVYMVWQIISQEEMEDRLATQAEGTFGGVNANVTYWLQDPFFDRGQGNFAGWQVGRTAGYTDTFNAAQQQGHLNWYRLFANCDDAILNFSTVNGQNTRRAQYDWYTRSMTTLAQLNADNNCPVYLLKESWDAPLLNKLQFDKWTGNNGYNYAQYEMAVFEGVGQAYQTITPTSSGQYMVSVHGMSSSAEAPGYVFVADQNGAVIAQQQLPQAPAGTQLYTIATNGIASNNTTYFRPQLPGSGTTEQKVVNYWVSAARTLDQGKDYNTTINFTAQAGNTYRVGVMKEKAVKCDTIAWYQNNWKLYFDTSWAAIDNIQIHFIGTEPPFLLNENKTNEDYIKSKNLTSTTVYLKRTFKKGTWTGFSLPVNMTSAEFVAAFGTEARLGRLDGVGHGDRKSGTSIDFTLVDLHTTENAVEAGKYYLINVSANPVHYQWVDADDGNTEYNGNFYRIGLKSLDGAAVMDTTTWAYTVENSAYPGTGGFTDGDLVANITYLKGEPAANATRSHWVPADCYYVLDGEMYHTNAPYRTKGFQGWLSTQPDATGAKPAITGFRIKTADEQSVVTKIESITDTRERQASADPAVYTLSGQRVADNASAISRLPQGIYISGGKKIIVK